MLVLLLGFTCSCSKDNDNTEKEKSSENKEASNNEETNNDIKVRLTSADLIDGSYFDGILYYRIISNTDNFVEISQVTKSAKSIEIPRKIIIDNTVFTVTSLGNNSFQDCKDLSYITIPSSITSVGNHAFSGCSILTALVLPNSISEIGHHAFYNCKELITFEIPDGVATIKESTFEGCERLLMISLPKSVSNIEKHAFRYCYSLSKIDIPDGVSVINEGTFENSGISKISLPNSISYIGNHAFKNSALRTIDIPDAVSEIKESTFEDCTGLETISLPENISHIGHHAFKNCSRLKDLTLPPSLNSIGEYAFEDCSSLSSVLVLGSPYDIGVSIFKNCKVLTNVVFDCSIVTPLFKGNDYINKVTMTGKVTEIEDAAFYGCENLTTLVADDEKDAYNSYPYDWCIGMRSFPESVTSIGKDAFAYCKKLDSFVISNGVTSIGDYAFAHIELNKVFIGRNVKNIGKQAFNCSHNYPYTRLFLCGAPPQTFSNFIDNSVFKNGKGCIHLLMTYIDDYKSTAPWSQFAILLTHETEEDLWNSYKDWN